jgi:hypothetical protein
MRIVQVSFSSPAMLTSIKVVIDYPDGTLQLPGTGNDTQVQTRVTNRPNGFLPDIFDFNYALQVGLAGTRGITTPQLFRVNFDNCSAADPPALSDFACRVTEANDTSFLPVSGVSCSVAFL